MDLIRSYMEVERMQEEMKQLRSDSRAKKAGRLYGATLGPIVDNLYVDSKAAVKALFKTGVDGVSGLFKGSGKFLKGAGEYSIELAGAGGEIIDHLNGVYATHRQQNRLDTALQGEIARRPVQNQTNVNVAEPEIEEPRSETGLDSGLYYELATDPNEPEWVRNVLSPSDQPDTRDYEAMDDRRHDEL